MANRKRMRLSEAQKEILLSRYNDLQSQGINDIFAVLSDDPVLLKNGIAGDRHQIRYAVKKAKGDDDDKENDEVLSTPNLFPNAVTVLDLVSPEDVQIKKKIKTEKTATVAKHELIQDEFTCTEVLDFFMENAYQVDPEITDFTLTQKIDGYT